MGASLDYAAANADYASDISQLIWDEVAYRAGSRARLILMML